MVRVPTPAAAALFVAALAVLFVVGGSGLRSVLGEGGVLASQWLLLFLPALLFVQAGGYDPASTLFLRVPEVRHLLAGALLIAGALPMAWAIGWLQGFVMTPPPELVEAMQRLLTVESPTRLAWLLLMLAVTPAICEEVVFRGVLLSATKRLSMWRVLALNGVVFGAFHLSFEAPVRFLPTAWLGVVITWAVLRSGSLATGVMMHFLNNSAIVLLATLPPARALVTDPEAAPPLWLLAAGAVSLVGGFFVMQGLSRSRRPWGPDAPGRGGCADFTPKGDS